MKILSIVSFCTVLIIFHVVAVPVRNLDASEESVPRAPKISGKNKLYIPTHMAKELRSLECHLIQGTPTPRVIWTKEGKEIGEPYKIKFNVTEGKAELGFPEHQAFEKSFEGNYSCVAVNFLGYDVKSFVIASATSASAAADDRILKFKFEK